MATIKQYRPNYFSGFKDKVVEFNSTNELFEIEFVKRFKETKAGIRKDFFRYSANLYEKDNKTYTLLAEYNNGFEWWVVGFISNCDFIDEISKSEFKDKKSIQYCLVNGVANIDRFQFRDICINIFNKSRECIKTNGEFDPFDAPLMYEDDKDFISKNTLLSSIYNTYSNDKTECPRCKSKNIDILLNNTEKKICNYCFNVFDKTYE